MSADGDGSERETLALFEAALEHQPEERARFVAAATAGRARLRARVEALLALEREGASLPPVLATPSLVDALLGEQQELAPGTVVGSFRIEGTLGRGGMGRVYVALQEQPRRRVALKTLLGGLHAESVRRRFQVEGELLGHLQHPGIAQVYETGVARVRSGEREAELPYIAMELLEEARPLVEHARAEGLDVDERVRLIVEAARAVHHAHQRGVIHRDLKPANLLVDADGHLRVIDFGIALASELDLATTTVRTLAGHVLGTPAYMSPEQLTLPGHELDTRADVYALGAVAYELVCGVPPVEAGERPFGALVQEITGEGPRRPRAVAPELSRDLEAVLLRALERDREERYASAAALADDLERFLRHETVEAKPPTLVHQLRLFARRNRLFSASLVLAGASLCIGATAALLFGLEAREAERLEREQRARADAFLAELFQENLALVFDFAEQAGAVRGGADLRLRLLGAAGERLEQLEEEARRDPALLASVARAYVRLGEALGGLDQQNSGDLQGADRAYRRAQELLAEVGTEEPLVVRARIDLAQARGDRARGEGDLERAQEHYQRAIALGREALERHPDAGGLRSELLRRVRDLGNTFGSMGQHERALALFEEVVAGWEQLLAQQPGDRTLRLGLANARSSVASATLEAVGPAESLPHFRASLEQLERILADHPDYRPADAARVGVRYPYTQALIEAGRQGEAFGQARAGLALAQELLETDPGDVQVRRWQGLLHHNAGWALHSRATLAAGEGREAALVRADLEAAMAQFLGSLAVFQDLGDAGQLMPVERGYLAAIRDKLAAVDVDLAALD